MRKIFISFFIFINILYSDTILINEATDIHIDEFNLEYFIDETSNINFQNIKKENFSKTINKNTFGNIRTTWYRFDIKNNTNKKLNLFFNDSLAYINMKTEIYELHGKKLLNKFTFDKNKLTEGKNPKDTNLIYPFELSSNQTKTIYIMHYSPVYQFFNFTISDIANTIVESSYNHIFDIFVIGMILALAIYNILLFINSKQIEYLSYTLFLMSGSIWIFVSSGSLMIFGILGQEGFKLLNIILLLPIFTVFFLKSIFDTTKKENFYLNSVIIILILNLIVAFFDTFLSLKLASYTVSYSIIVSISVAISQHLNENPIAKIFIVAHVSYIISVIISNLFFLGFLPFHFLTLNSDNFGLVIESILFAYLISYRIKLLQYESISKDKEILIQTEIANKDFLTNAYNRRFFFDASQAIISRAKRNNYSLAIATIDIDHFKVVNDTYGHDAGDEAIKEVVKILNIQLRDSDLFARFGGEEFCIIIENISQEETLLIFEKIRLAFQDNVIQYNDLSISYTVSIGISYGFNNSINEMILTSDKALYNAKSNGRNQIQLIQI